MRKYLFLDSDSTGWEEYDISGNAYQALLRTCFQYSSYVSFRICMNGKRSVTLPDQLEQYRFYPTVGMGSMYSQDETSVEIKSDRLAYYEKRYYTLSSETQEILLGVTDSIFKWIYGWGQYNPEDIAFFREDGSAFFESEIHNGKCMLLPKHDEDVSDVLSYGGWIETDE